MRIRDPTEKPFDCRLAEPPRGDKSSRGIGAEEHFCHFALPYRFAMILKKAKEIPLI